MKIKKYIIDQEIPKNIKASDFLESKMEDYFPENGLGGGSGYIEKRKYFYFLVEEETEIDFSKNKPNSEKVLAGFNKMREGITCPICFGKNGCRGYDDHLTLC